MSLRVQKMQKRGSKILGSVILKSCKSEDQSSEVEDHSSSYHLSYCNKTEYLILKREVSNRQDFYAATTTIAIKIRAIGPLCSLLRRVCAPNRPEWSTLPSTRMVDPAKTWQAFLH